MRQVHEYEAWSLPGGNLPADYGKVLARELHAAGIPKEAFIGHYELPDETDAVGLSMDIANGNLTMPDFQKFCLERGLSGKLEDVHAAARFLEHSYGRELAWIHISTEDDPGLLKKIEGMLSSKGVKVVDPGVS